jgi:hypothetical protein
MHAKAHEWRIKPVNRSQDAVDAVFIAAVLGLVAGVCWPLDHYWAEYLGLFFKSSEDFRPAVAGLGGLMFLLSFGGVTYALFFYLPRVFGKPPEFGKVQLLGAEESGFGKNISRCEVWLAALLWLGLGRSRRIDALGYDHQGWWVRKRGLKKYVLFNQYSVRSSHLIILRWDYWPWSGVLIRPSTLEAGEGESDGWSRRLSSVESTFEGQTAPAAELAFRRLNSALAIRGMI